MITLKHSPGVNEARIKVVDMHATNSTRHVFPEPCRRTSKLDRAVG